LTLFPMLLQYSQTDQLQSVTHYYPEVGAIAFFAVSRSRARRQNKSAKARRKKSAKKSESTERESKKARIRAFSPTHTGNRVLEPKATRQGGKQGPCFA
jgi:hypothetical protein